MTTAPPNRPFFVRRSNRDGSIDSICRRCFMTAATAFRESDLDRSEREHLCDPDWSHRYEAPKAAIFDRRSQRQPG